MMRTTVIVVHKNIFKVAHSASDLRPRFLRLFSGASGTLRGATQVRSRVSVCDTKNIYIAFLQAGLTDLD